ncbi:MAG: DUF2759 family protein [Oscillospiraceae bacterium]
MRANIFALLHAHCHAFIFGFFKIVTIAHSGFQVFIGCFHDFFPTLAYRLDTLVTGRFILPRLLTGCDSLLPEPFTLCNCIFGVPPSDVSAEMLQ